MKKLLLSLLISSALIASCSKEGRECYWTDSFGNDWSEYPTPTEIQEMEDSCSCAVTFTKHCN